MDDAYYPTLADVTRLRKHVETYRALYERAIRLARHRYHAHRQARGRENVQSLFAKGKVEELRRLSTFLVHLHRCLWDLLENGFKPALPSARNSIRSIYESGAKHESGAKRGGPHERIVDDMKRLMRFIEDAP